MTSAVSASTERIRKINVLVPLFITVCACAVSFLAKQAIYQMIFTCLLFILMASLGFMKAGLKFLLVYAICELWLRVNLHFGIGFPSPMMFTFIIEFIPIIMPVYLAVQVPSGKLTAGLRQLPIPTKMMLTVIVILRFMPTILSEFSDVKDAMRTRGFLRSPSRVLLHPLATMEYVAVPMIFRSLKIADELASSCMVRGIESPYKKQGYYVNKMRAGDVLLMAAFLTATILSLVL